MKLNTFISNNRFMNFYLLLFIITFSSSVFGQWSSADKKRFQTDMNAVEELSNFGENKQRWIDCYLQKCESHYTSYDEANKDAKGCEKLALDCGNEIYSNGSIKGKWSDADKQTFYADMEAVQELSSLGENKKKWIDCYFSKCQTNYGSYYLANSDQKGCEKLAMECNADIQK